MTSWLMREWNRSRVLPLSAIGWGYLAYAYLLHALHIYTPPVCLFYLLTGLHCPLCGMTRAFGMLMAGKSTEATHLYPFVVPAFALWVALSFFFASVFAVRAHRVANFVRPNAWGRRLCG
jgi:hypothetical protein